MTDTILSVIMPSLNVYPYIRQCIESVCAQTLSNIEIICVDAGSTDGTYQLIQSYQKMDSRIRLFLSERKSYGYQVNLGIRKARGRYIAIVDTDDIILPGMYETLCDIALKNRADFVKADYVGFSDRDGCCKKIKTFHFLENKDLYGKLINAKEYPEIYVHNVVGTWSGIYKRSYLFKNDIWHNETIGASFQDTGFWFLSYAFATRAIFVDKPYYLYRLDNTNSSTYDVSKVYCICDEFQYIYQKLKAARKYFVFSDVFTQIFYYKYKRNMERILPQDREEFIQRFAADFRTLDIKKDLDLQKLNYDERLDLHAILKEPIIYYRSILHRRKLFCQALQQYPFIIIYGAGRVGKDLFTEIEDKSRVLCFAVTKGVGSQYLEGKCVKEICEMISYRRTAVVVIAVKIEQYKKQMLELSRQLGFDNIITIPFGLYDF